MKKSFSKLIAGAILALMVTTQVLTIGGVLLIPQQAEAQLGGAVVVLNPNINQDANVAIWERIAIGVARGILEKFTESFLNRFTNKLVDKYKIRNFLYYDRVLSDYYLNRYIADNVTDPDLRNIYSLMEKAYVTGASTGTTGAPDPRKALIPRLNEAIAKAYVNQGGIDPNRIYNPSSYKTDREYFAAVQAYFSSPPSFTEQNLQGQFGAFQSSATTASQLEILAANALKSGRVVGGTCKGADVKNPNPTTCKAAGGTWQDSALDQARSFIDNPSTVVQNNLDAAIKQHFNNLYNPATDFWTQVGKSFGRFIWGQLGLDKSGGTLPDSPTGYEGTDYGDPSASSGAGSLSEGDIDLDGDGIADATDYTGDGVADLCRFGGTPPNCTLSTTVINGGEDQAMTCAQIPSAMACEAPDHTALVQRVKDYLIAQGQQFNTYCDAFEIVKRVAWALKDEGVGLLTTPHSTQCNGFSADVIAYTDSSGVDILGSAGPPDNVNAPAWQPAPATGESGVHYAPPSDPGDPPGSY